MVPLHSKMGNRARHCLKKIKEQQEAQVLHTKALQGMWFDDMAGGGQGSLDHAGPGGIG